MICDPRCGLSWRMFHVHLRRRCSLLHLDGMSWRYRWDPAHLVYHLRRVSLLIFCFDDLSIGVSGVLKLPAIIVLLSISPFMSVSVCLMYWGAHMFSAYLQLLCLPLGVIPWWLCMSFLISCNILYFKVYFVWYEDCCSSFLLFPICMEYVFPSSHFQSIYDFTSEVGFL